MHAVIKVISDIIRIHHIAVNSDASYSALQGGTAGWQLREISRWVGDSRPVKYLAWVYSVLRIFRSCQFCKMWAVSCQLLAPVTIACRSIRCSWCVRWSIAMRANHSKQCYMTCLSRYCGPYVENGSFHWRTWLLKFSERKHDMSDHFYGVLYVLRPFRLTGMDQLLITQLFSLGVLYGHGVRSKHLQFRSGDNIPPKRFDKNYGATASAINGFVKGFRQTIDFLWVCLFSQWSMIAHCPTVQHVAKSIVPSSLSRVTLGRRLPDWST